VLDDHRPGTETAITTPVAAHLLVCIGPSCAERGSRSMLADTWSTLEREDLAYYCSGGTIRLTATDCLGACAQGPTVMAYVRDRTDPTIMHEEPYVAMTAASTATLARRCHGGRPDSVTP
jgi:(2Fe-2S) ferredoxin